MSNLLRKQTWKGALTVLCGACIAFGVTAATTSGAGTMVTLDHQLCYTAAGKFHPPAAKSVLLIDQFSPNGFSPIIRPALELHCNPVIKIVRDPAGGQQVFKPVNPRAHLACLPFTLPPGLAVPAPPVVVTNQFGSATLYLKQPNLLCLPSWTNMTAPPKMSPTTPPRLNHFTCYPVGDMTGAYKIPPDVLLRDQFAAAPVQVQINPFPQELCLPTKKVVTTATGTKTYPMVDPAAHLLCFGGIKTPTKPKLYDENQFGTSLVHIRAAKWLCVPSTKQVVKK
jgi:hypothetical protein